MKHKNNNVHIRNRSLRLTSVRFEFNHPTAATVCVAGCFNQWHPTTEPMHPLGNGHWLNETALSPGTYEYCLVVDGQWVADPTAKENVPNPFGGNNSVLRVASSPEAKHFAAAENLPMKIRKQGKRLKL